ncbi:uncharacterized protein C20orf85 homolog [Sipha flava]|uniref:Uncharacterized protein C20orf85 homolog n=1 Tax=Sipha flava TaxID=143950 RepID=A0A8B8GDE3_9HEMI|nr:uncharacterized protein C20orf85 homolog [Sipha flava]
MARRNVSVADDEIFRNRCEHEIKAHDNWPKKWGWILDENKKTDSKLQIIKEIKEDFKYIDPRHMFPFPITTSKEIGWLSSKQEFQLEIYGPDIMCLPIGKETK